MTGQQYSLDCFRNNSILYKLAEKYDSNAQKGNNDRILNGNEVSLFTTELKNKGINFDFEKLNDNEYINSIEENYEQEIKNQKYREHLIEEYKDEYNIELKKHTDGKNYYFITAQKDVNLSGLTSELGFGISDVNNNNHGYGQYDYDGHYIGNRPMKSDTIRIPVQDFGKANKIANWWFNLWN